MVVEVCAADFGSDMRTSSDDRHKKRREPPSINGTADVRVNVVLEKTTFSL